MAIIHLWPPRGNFLYMFCFFRIFTLTAILFCISGLAKPSAAVIDGSPRGSRQITLGSVDQSPELYSQSDGQHSLSGKTGGMKDTLKTMLDAFSVMQSEYFVLWHGTWPTGIDWTNAVMATQVSATLSALSWTLGGTIFPSGATAASASGSPDSEPLDTPVDENLIDYYFQHTSAFWFGEDVLAVRLQAYDDMLWVVLEWLENLKFQSLHNDLHYSSYPNASSRLTWHGNQFKLPAAHRARVFYELAARGWNTTLCDGGMIWSPYLAPYKNAITNELFISASIGMYIYFPGDDIDIPILTKPTSQDLVSKPLDPAHLDAAITAYGWLKESGMLGINDLYADGFHVSGWSEDDPGTGKCDVLNTMIYSYNQGVILSGMRGLWLATGSKGYMEDGHELIENVMKSTGWSNTSRREWRGLGRGGVLEEACDSSGSCSQNGHTFKGIFFQHLSEFCRPLTPFEERFLSASSSNNGGGASELEKHQHVFMQHQRKCSSYRSWIEHNAHAAYVTKNDEGKFGMWWGRKYPDYTSDTKYTSTIPPGAIDYQNLEAMVNRPGEDGTPDFIRRQTERTRGRQMGKSARLQAEGEDLDTGGMRKERPGLDVNDRGRGRTLETQASALAVFRALYNWQTAPSLNGEGDA